MSDLPDLNVDAVLPDVNVTPIQASDLSQPTNLIEGWANATERVLQATSGTRRDQWLRTIILTIYAASTGEGIDVSNMRINFTVKKMTNSSPNSLEARIYNLAPQTMEKVKLYNRVQLSAGYQRGNYGIIFDGKVALYVRGQENTVDTYLDVFANDAEPEINNGTVLLSWPAGTTPEQKVKDAWKQNNIAVGEIKMEGGQKSLRASAYAGMMYNLIRDQTNATGSDHFIDDGKGYVIPRTGYRAGEAVTLSPQTGLVGIPQVTPQGIEAKCLLNSKLRIGGLVKINSTALSGVPFEPGSLLGSSPFSGLLITGFGQRFAFAATSPVGTYKILSLDQTGDTRGQPWYSVMMCIALDAANNAIFASGAPSDAFNRSAQPAR